MIDDAVRDVLVVDQDADRRRLVREALEERLSDRVRITEAPEIGLALGLLRGGSYDIVLVDRSFREADGRDALESVLGGAPDTPVVVHTKFVREGELDALADSVRNALRMPVSADPQREARLRPEFAAIYPDVRPSQWGPASIIAQRVLVRILRYSPPGSLPRGRVLQDEHFEFRGGGLGRGPSRAAARTRVTD